MKKIVLLTSSLVFLIACNSSNTISETSSFSSDIFSSNISSSEEILSSSSSLEEISSIEEISSSNSSEEINSINSSEESIYSSEEISSNFSEEVSSITSSESDSIIISSSEEIKYYTVTFIDYDGTILYEDNFVLEGDYPVYEANYPTREDSDTHTYTFNGWDKDLAPTYEDTTYTATYIEEEIYYTVYDLLSFDGDYPIYYQKEVSLKNVGIVSVYSSDSFIVTPTDNPLDRYCIDVKSTSDITGIFDRHDIVHVNGVVDVINGRAYINNATVTWGDGGENYCDNYASIGTVKLPDREYWNNNIDKYNSGSFYYGHMNIATIPEITVGKDISFYITFPGEDIEVSERNPFLIEVRIPSLNVEQASFVSDWIAKFNEGDGIYINFQAYYDNKMMGLMTYDNLEANKRYNIPYTHTNVHQDYKNVEEFILEEYPTYISFPNMYHEDVYNYVTKYLNETINGSTTGYVRITFYTYEIEKVLSFLTDLYANTEEFTYIGLKDDNKYWVTHPYSPNFDLDICFYESIGKIVFETHLIY